MKNRIIALVVIVLSFSISAVADQNLKLESSSGTIEFLAKGPLVRVQGKGEGATGELKIKEGKASGVLSLNLESLNTGISLRDDHMKNKYLQIAEHPVAKLTLKDIELPKKLKGKVKFTGLLSLHGETKEVSGTVKLKGVKGGKAKITADFKVRFSDFNIELPSFKLVSVGEDIKIKVKTQAVVSEVASKEKTAAL